MAEARDVSLRLGGAVILDGVSLTVRTGEVLALVGPNGAGKSTLLGVLSGDHTPDTGAVHLAGEPLSHWSPVETAMRRAVMLQQSAISFPFSVADIVAMGRSPWHNTPRATHDEAAIQEALTTADITPFTHRTFNSLSGGERARVSLARALAQQTQLLLLDEPTAALDLHHQEAVLQLARAQAADADAVVVVVHDLNLAAGYADRVVVLDGGKVMAEGGPKEVLTAEVLSGVYRHPVEVWEHPGHGGPVILPRR
ncbi:heme ABC transporter ATP-binding protein [Kribbella sandramycini]|uniref:heme ABC transporter ATP-binding protein n=1 Tax=Kribbella sandramycini TaxID=60450 RepID=UPI00307EA12B